MPSRLRSVLRHLAMLLPPVRSLAEQRDRFARLAQEHLAESQKLAQERDRFARSAQDYLAESQRLAIECQALKEGNLERDAKIQRLTEESAALSRNNSDLANRNAAMAAELEAHSGKIDGLRKVLAGLVAVNREPTLELRRSIAQAKLSLEVERGSQWADELAGLLNWPEIRNPVEQSTGMPELLEMLRLFAAGSRSMNQLSSCWQVLGFKNFNQLLRDGYRNFKRTIGFNYFTFLVQKGDPQIAYLESKLDAEECAQLRQAAAYLPDDPDFNSKDQHSYRYFVLMLWSYARKADKMQYLERLEEPEEGNPLTVPASGKRASQDLANSVLEYYSMSEAVDFAQCKRVLEIGGGYGRDAYVIMKLHPHIQYTLVDIPPALWVAQRYLSSVFSDRKVFRVRDFETYQDVADEMEAASIVCLLPHQAELLPHGRFDLSMNISSFGEMQPEQINTYFQLLERLTSGYFYTKQWKISQNAFDHLTLTEESYPVSRNWTRVYSRTCQVQNAFFEALYRVTGQRS